MSKLVTETIYDYMRFTRDGEPISDMGIGINKLIREWLTKYHFSKHLYKINENHKITVYDVVILSNRLKEKELPEYIQFDEVHGGFHCDHNKLVSLQGVAETISGSFICKDNNLKSLKYGPRYVDKDYSASYNKLESLEGIASYIGGSLWVSHNNIKSLKYCPSEINGNLDIAFNSIETLDHFPIVWGDLTFTPNDKINKQLIKEKLGNKIHGKIIAMEDKIF